MKKSLLLIVCLFFIAKGITYAQNPILLGMTAKGGAHAGGVIFKINYDGSGFTVLHDFSLFSGRAPYGSLIRAKNGLYYGTTNTGGVDGAAGVIFSFDISNNAYDVVHSFSTTDGQGYNAQCTLLEASDGNLYGMTGAGGTNNLGVLFKFNPANNTYIKLVDFNGTNGASPYHNSLIQARNGLLYGLTAAGGKYNAGVLFSYSLINSTYNSYNMPVDDNPVFTYSFYPNGRLIESNDGLLRGTTVSSDFQCNSNSASEGTLINFYPGDGTAIAYDFGMSICFEGAIANGAYPYGSLIEQSPGVFYGMNSGDAAYALLPNIFKYQSSNGTVTELYDFSGSDGLLPYGSFITGNDGKLYAMTWSGGAHNDGVVFRFDPADKNRFVKIHDFDGVNGANPYADLITASCILPGTPGFITGNVLFCPDSTQTYTIAPVAGAASYTWTVPAGSSIQGPETGVSIKVLMGNVAGSITVKAKNACGFSPSSSKLLAILPARPGVITGNFLFCPGSTQTYTIAPVAGAISYKWTVPAGSSIQGAKTGVSIKVLMGTKTGSIKVWAKTACAISRDSSSKTLAIHCATFTEAQAHIAFMADISPNPTTGNITLQFNSSGKDNYSVTVIDIVGKMVMNIKGTCEPGLNTIHLDLSKFAKGIYMVTLEEGYNKKLITKIVLQ